MAFRTPFPSDEATRSTKADQVEVCMGSPAARKLASMSPDDARARLRMWKTTAPSESG
jgi:hypothetical protein